MCASNNYRRRSYLERYERGRCEEVWLELTALGPVIRQEPLYRDAVAVARETMGRVRHNCELLVERLKTLEYRFSCEHEDKPYLPVQLADATDLAWLDQAERTHGPLPLSARLLYETIASIDFRGDHPTLSTYSDAGWRGSEHVPYTDPLCIVFFDPMDDTVEGVSSEAIPPLGRFASFFVMPDIVMKAGASGGMPTEMIFPNPAMDAHFIHGDWPGMLLVSYLRLSFTWGGFAGFSYLPEAAAKAKAELAFLTKDLLPI